MADAITSISEASLQLRRVAAAGFFGGDTQKYDRALKALFSAAGVAADQVNLLYVKRHSFLASTQQTIALNAAVGDDGVTSNFFRVRLVAIAVRSVVDAANLTVDNAGATNPFTGFLNAVGQVVVRASTADSTGALKNNGFALFSAPNTTGMVVGTGINLRLLPSAHAFDADVIVAGGNA